ncbi:hypothetical protein CBL_12296 [Carabus blaptoides fortunei]
MKQDVGETWTIIVAYGVNHVAQKEEKDKFFENLQKEIDEGKETVIIMGDLNGEESETTTKEWKSTYKNKWSHVTNVKVNRNAEIGSDHYLLRMELRVTKIEKNDKRRMRTKEKIKSYKLTELSVQKKYQEILKIKFNRTDKKIGIEEKWDRFKKIILEAARELWREEDYEEYKEKRKVAKMEVNRAKQESWEKFGEKMTRNYREKQETILWNTKTTKKDKRLTAVLNVGSSLSLVSVAIAVVIGVYGEELLLH